MPTSFKAGIASLLILGGCAAGKETLPESFLFMDGATIVNHIDSHYGGVVGIFRDRDLDGDSVNDLYLTTATTGVVWALHSTDDAVNGILKNDSTYIGHRSLSWYKHKLYR